MHFVRALKIIRYGNLAHDKELAFQLYSANFKWFDEGVSFNEFYNSLTNTQTEKPQPVIEMKLSKDEMVKNIYGLGGEKDGI